MKRLRCLWLIAGIIGHSSGLVAGGTIYYHPTDGTPLQWEVGETGKAKIHYTVDAGGLGRLTHGQALMLLQAAMDIWESVANVEFIFDGTTDVDVDETNYQSYTATSICDDNFTSSNFENNVQFTQTSLIVFDNSAESVIIDDAEGIGGTGNSYAITDITCINGTRADPDSIASAQIIFNGAAIDGTNDNVVDRSVNAMTGIMVHELGHFLGLDHSDVNGIIKKAIHAGEIAVEYNVFLPTMAQAFTDFSGEFAVTLHPDDIAAIQALYPLEDDSPTSVLTGTVTESNGNEFRGAQIELRNINDPLCEAISFISGKQCTILTTCEGCLISMAGDTCEDSNNEGEYFLRAVPPGQYGITTQEIIDDYKEGEIHPFSQFMPLPELVGVAEFYNGGDTSADDPLTMSAVTVVDGEDIEGLDIVLSSSTADGDGEENLLDLSVFSQSPFTDSLTVTASSRCQANTVDYAALIGVEELVGSDGEEEEETESSSSSGCSLVNIL